MTRAPFGPKPEPEEGPLRPTPWTIAAGGAYVRILDANGYEFLRFIGVGRTTYEQDRDVAYALVKVVNGSVEPAETGTETGVRYIRDNDQDYWFELGGKWVLSFQNSNGLSTAYASASRRHDLGHGVTLPEVESLYGVSARGVFQP